MKKEKEIVLSHYEVVAPNGEILFKDDCYSICNSFICKNAIMGVRPKPVYIRI